MSLFDDISVGYVSIMGKIYPRISMEEADIPSNSGEIESVVLEKYTVSWTNSGTISDLANDQGEPIEIYYSGDHLFLDLSVSSIIDLGAVYEYDILDKVRIGLSSFVDSDTDLSEDMYVYRMTYELSGEISGESNYVLAAEIPSGMGEDTDIASILGNPLTPQGSVYRMGKPRESLYQTPDNGIMVEKGIPMVHSTPRYRGPIELSKERARRTSLYGTQEYLELLLDEIEEDIVELSEDMTVLGNTIVKDRTQASEE